MIMNWNEYLMMTTVDSKSTVGLMCTRSVHVLFLKKSRLESKRQGNKTLSCMRPGHDKTKTNHNNPAIQPHYSKKEITPYMIGIAFTDKCFTKPALTQLDKREKLY